MRKKEVNICWDWTFPLPFPQGNWIRQLFFSLWVPQSRSSDENFPPPIRPTAAATASSHSAVLYALEERSGTKLNTSTAPE